MRMLRNDSIFARPRVNASKAIPPLQELLALSIGLRDLYKSARRKTLDAPYSRLHQVFDNHYKEQSRLVDVLIDRLRTLDGVDHVLACDLLQDTQIACAMRSQRTRKRLFHELLEAHESVLSAARPGGTGDGPDDRSWVRDFGVGQVIITNECQSQSICELLLGRINDPSAPTLVAMCSE